MIPTAPQIGFDRFIQLDWVAAALKVRAGAASLDELNELLDAAGLGVAARKKTRTVLNRLWLEPRLELADFAKRGVEIHRTNAGALRVVVQWRVGMGSDVRRQSNGADIHRAAWADLRCPLLRIGRVARKHR